MGVEGVDDAEGGVVTHFDGAVAGCEEDVPRGRGVGEDGLVYLVLTVLLVVRGAEREVWGGDGKEDVVLAGCKYENDDEMLISRREKKIEGV